MKTLKEEIKQQPNVTYKGYTIVHFPYTFTFKDRQVDIDGYIIESPYHIEGFPDAHLPFYCEDEKGDEIDFKTLEAAKSYIDKYMEPKRGKIVIKHGDEVHFELDDQQEVTECVLDANYTEALVETFETHQTLNPKLWDLESETLNPIVRKKLLQIAGEFIEGLNEKGIDFNVVDIVLVGSNCSYTYTENSDLDVHVMTDIEDLDGKMSVIFDLYKTNWNKKYDLAIKDIPVELFVEINHDGDVSDLEGIAHNAPLQSAGIYSILNDAWVKEPAVEDIPEVDEEALQELINEWEARYESLINQSELNLTEEIHTKLIDDIDNFLNSLYELRAKGLADEGEFSLENLLFKELRNKGYIQQLKELKVSLVNKELSLAPETATDWMWDCFK